jgi:predicted regulator of Ras-like GTPase activity (Roadblock/LC7/MglB family)
MFRESLQKMIDRLEGGVAGILMGFDGISVESYTRSNGPGNGVGNALGSADIQTVGMEMSHIIGQVRRAASSLEIGGLSEVTFQADKLAIVVRVLNEEYFVAVAVRPEGNFGKARYLLRMLAPQIQSEL